MTNKITVFLLTGFISAVCLTAFSQDAPVAPPVGLIFDTDLGNDADDALALAMIHRMESQGSCRLLAVTLSKDHPLAAECASIINEYFGRGAIPVGRVKDGVSRENREYLIKLAGKLDENGQFVYPRRITRESVLPEAVALIRKTLAAQPDNSVVIIQVGFSTNLARLIDSPADEFSPLTGKELILQKVRFLSLMGGEYSTNNSDYSEFNIKCDIPSAQKIFRDWPGKLVASGFEIGKDICVTKSCMNADVGEGNNPVRDVFFFYRGAHAGENQSSWDLTSVLYAVRPNRGYFTLSQPGTITVTDSGQTHFTPSEEGNRFFLKATPVQKAMVQGILQEQSSQRGVFPY